MTFRAYATLVSILTAPASLLVWVLFVIPPAIESDKSWLIVAAGVGWLVFGNLTFLAVVRTLRCPKCGARFGWNNYCSGIFFHIWPSRTCPNCHEEMW